VSEAGERHEAFDEEICEFDEEAEFRDTNDESIEIVADAILHEFDFVPFHQLAFSLVRTPLSLAGLFGNVMKLFDGDRTSKRFGGSVLSSLWPGSSAALPGLVPSRYSNRNLPFPTFCRITQDFLQNSMTNWI